MGAKAKADGRKHINGNAAEGPISLAHQNTKAGKFLVIPTILPFFGRPLQPRPAQSNTGVDDKAICEFAKLRVSAQKRMLRNDPKSSRAVR